MPSCKQDQDPRFARDDKEGQVEEEMKPSKPQPATETFSLTSGPSPSSPPSSAGRRAKIICTIGPACNSEAAMRDLLRLGMDVARLNFSHGSHEDHARNIERLRRAAGKEDRTVCILQDLQGPKIRTGRLAPRTCRAEERLDRHDYAARRYRHCHSHFHHLP